MGLPVDRYEIDWDWAIEKIHPKGEWVKYDDVLSLITKSFNKVCIKDCIHYGKKHPCVFCVRDPKNKDHYEQGNFGE